MRHRWVRNRKEEDEPGEECTQTGEEKDRSMKTITSPKGPQGGRCEDVKKKTGEDGASRSACLTAVSLSLSLSLSSVRSALPLMI